MKRRKILCQDPEEAHAEAVAAEDLVEAEEAPASEAVAEDLAEAVEASAADSAALIITDRTITEVGSLDLAIIITAVADVSAALWDYFSHP